MSDSMNISGNVSDHAGSYAQAARSPGKALLFHLTTVKLAWRNMWRNWRRTTIALVAIVLGLLMLLFMDGLIKGSDEAIFGNAVRLYGGNVQIHAPGFRAKAKRLPLLAVTNPDSVVATAKTLPQVRSVSKRINTGGMISSREGAFSVAITAVEPAQEAAHSIQAENTVAGRYLLPEDGDAVFIGQGLADLLNVAVGDRVTLLGRGAHEQMRQRTMTIVGIYDLGMDEAEKGIVFITLPEAQSLYDLRDQATEVTIGLNQVGQEGAVLAALQSVYPELEVDSWETLRPELRQTMDTKASVSGFFGFIVLLIASIGILNLMLMAVFERTREMGVLAALGMKNRQIMELFLVEGTLIGIVGAVIGCVVGAIVVAIFGRVGFDLSAVSNTNMGEITALMGSRIYTSFSLAEIISRGLLVAVIAALASLYPAWQASRQEPAVALHHV